MNVNMSDLLFGGSAGLVTVFVIYGLWSTSGRLYQQEKRLYERQSIRLYTDETPAEIEFVARRARQRRYQLNMLIGCGVWLGLELFFPEIARQLLHSVVLILKHLLGWLHGITLQLVVQLG